MGNKPCKHFMQKTFRTARMPVLLRWINNRFFWFLTGISYILLLAGCTQTDSEKSSLVKFYGNSTVTNFSQNFYLYSTRCHFGQPGALMASPGDILLMENWLVINEASVKNKNGSIHFVDSDSVLLLNGKVAGIEIDTAYTLSKLVDLNDKEAIRQLKVVSITHEGYVAFKPELEKIASINPGCMLMVSGKYAEDELKWLLEQFEPSFLMIELPGQQQHLLAGETQLQTLYLSNNDSIYQCQPIPNLPNLRDFYFAFDGDSIAQGPDSKNWLTKNPQIKNLTVTDWEEAYPKGMLAALEAPEVLIMGGMDIPAEEILAHTKTLKRVITDSGELQLELPGVNELIVFNINEPQHFLENISKKKPECSALEIFEPKKNLDLSPLLTLKKLEALTLIDADSIAVDPLKEMKQLKLLSYSTDSTNMDSTIAVLQTALPGTLVVANDGLCLGSGWLMALVPALFAAMGLAVYRRKKQAGLS
jgi:hypothetical protein